MLCSAQHVNRNAARFQREGKAAAGAEGSSIAAVGQELRERRFVFQRNAAGHAGGVILVRDRKVNVVPVGKDADDEIIRRAGDVGRCRQRIQIIGAVVAGRQAGVMDRDVLLVVQQIPDPPGLPVDRLECLVVRGGAAVGVGQRVRSVYKGLHRVGI